MTIRPNIRRIAPYSHGHMGLALNSVNRVCIYEPRIATVGGTIAKNGPSVRASMRVRIGGCSGVPIVLPPSSPRTLYRPPVGLQDRWSVRPAAVSGSAGFAQGWAREHRAHVDPTNCTPDVVRGLHWPRHRCAA